MVVRIYKDASGFFWVRFSVKNSETLTFGVWCWGTKINYLSMARPSTYPGEINFTERWHCQGDSRHSGSKSSVCGLSHIFSLSFHGNGALLLTRQDHLDVVEKKSLSFNCRICLSVVGCGGFNCLSLCHRQRPLHQTVSCNYNFNNPFNSSYTHITTAIELSFSEHQNSTSFYKWLNS